MTAVRAGSAQKPLPQPLVPSAADHLPISRETGVVEPPHQLRPGESKPWAHFVAGA